MNTKPELQTHTLKIKLLFWCCASSFAFLYGGKEKCPMAATDMACKSGLNWSLKRQYPIVISWKLCTWITQAEPEEYVSTVVSYHCIPVQIWIMLLKLQVYCSATIQYLCIFLLICKYLQWNNIWNGNKRSNTCCSLCLFRRISVTAK